MTFTITTARVIAPVIALLITCTVLLVELSYSLGYQLGSAIHQCNDQLSALWRRLWVQEVSGSAHPAETQPQPAVSGSQQGPVSPLQHPLSALASELEAMTCKQLRELTGIRSKVAKTQLVAMAIAC